MVRRKSLTAEDLDFRGTEAVLGVNSGRYKSSYEAAKQSGLSRDTCARHVNEGLSRSQARQAQQILSSVLLKRIEQLIISDYPPGHQLLKEMAEKVRNKLILQFRRRVT
ncbi:hypothetical protein LIPSTDRAFT_337287 [Lipomyces starkeyi NRRL Y-11557]|uniref:HTH psq-type domain-containing protein n=1 Tax=Lipomyces starkeyi NRRL Y-11557 TaxID=675824 RepID=A0A1E3PTI4_LIPST|nr:hypothetical protein LIPSTDRAFT_337287 [Lipomyces starkeyi NRRL Y-11557]